MIRDPDDEITVVPLRKRMSTYNFRVTVEHDRRALDLYEGQSGVNATNFYTICKRTTRFLRGTATVRLATLEGKKEVGGFMTRIRNGDAEEDHKPYGIQAA